MARMGRSGAPGSIAPARTAAFAMLLALERDSGVRSDAVLRGPEMERLAPADRHLTTALVMGALRWQLALDARIAKLLARRAALDPAVRVALRLGVFQLWWMDRIPARAAIHDSVELAKRSGHRFASGMVNAVLRRMAEGPRPEIDPAEAHPQWMRERWTDFYGAASARAICGYDQQPPPAALRLGSAEAERKLAEAGVELAPGELVAAARRVVKGDAVAAEALGDGAVWMQDEGSQLVAELAGGGQRILDCCAAPGGKTAILAERNPAAEVVACDISAHRLEALRERLERRPETARVRTVLADASRLDAWPEIEGEFDLILCDAPCSGTGTLARHPEIKLRLAADELTRQQERQVAILGSALGKLAPGGRLAYSTCSLEPEENDAVVARVLKEHPEARVAPVAERLDALQRSGVLRGESAARLRADGVRGQVLQTIPGVLPCDGFFMAMLTRKPGR